MACNIDEMVLAIDEVEMQITAVHCAAAVAKMILAYHHVHHSQEHIAHVMRIDVDGISVPDQMSAYAELSDGALRARAVDDPDFETAVAAIRNHTPFQSSIYYGTQDHARAIFGYSSAEPEPRLWVCDPLNGWQGWERWDEVLHTLFLAVSPSG